MLVKMTYSGRKTATEGLQANKCSVFINRTDAAVYRRDEFFRVINWQPIYKYHIILNGLFALLLAQP